MPVITETLEEWALRHTTEGPAVVDPQTRNEIYPDGAVRFMNGQFTDPPLGNDSALLRLRRKYWFIRLRNEVDDFQKFQASELEQAVTASNYAGGPVPCPGMASVEQLKLGRGRVIELRKKIDALDAEISNLPESVAAREQIKLIDQRQQQARRMVGALQAVTLDDLSAVSE